MTNHSLALLLTVLCPVVCALFIFLIQRKATKKRRLLTFFLGLPLFVLPTVLLLTDFPGLFEGIVSAEELRTVPSEISLSLICALGMAYLGISSAVCAERIYKTGGLVFLSVSTLVFPGLEFALSYLTLVRNAGAEHAPNLGTLFPALTGALADLSVRFLIILFLVLFLICFSLSFLSLRKASDLQAEDIIRLHREEERERRIEKEGVCAVCRYAVPCKDDPLSVICDKKGKRDSDDRCRRFEYDPLKRVPEKKPNSRS